MSAISSLFQAHPSTRQTGIRQRSLIGRCRLGRATELVFILTTGVVLSLGPQAQAQSLVWDSDQTGPGSAGIQDGDEDWNLTEDNWQLSPSGPNQLFVNGNSVTFSAATTGSLLPTTVTIDDATVSPSAITFTASGYQISRIGINVIDVTTALAIDVTGSNTATLNVPLTMGVGETILVNGVAGSTGTLTLTSGADVNGGAAVEGTLSVANGTLITSSGTEINATVSVNGGTLTNAGIINGATTVVGGTLNINTGSNLANSQVLTINAGIVNVNADDTVGGLAGTSGTLNFTANNGLTVNQAGISTFGGPITGATATGDNYLIKQGAGILTLSGANTTTGAGRVQVTGGVLVLQGGNAIGDNNLLSISSSLVDLQANETLGMLIGTATGTLQLNGSTLTLNGSGAPTTEAYAGAITGAGGVTMNAAGSTQQFNAALAYTGATTVTAGTFELGASDILANGSSVVVNGGTLSMQANNDTVASVSLQSGSITGTGTLTSTTTFDVQGGNAGAVLGGTVGLTKTTSGIATLTGANTYTGTTSVSGGQLNITGAGSVSSTQVDVLGGLLVVDAAALAAGAAVSVAAPGTLRVDGANTVASLGQTGGTVESTAASTLTVTGAYTQSAGTTGGNITVTAGSFTQSGGASVGLGTTVNSAGAKLLQAGTIAGTLGGAGLTTVEAGTTTLSGTIGGAVTVTSRLEVTGTGSLTGGTTLSGGELHALGTVTLGQAIITGGVGASVISAATGQTLTLTTLNPNVGEQLTIGETGLTGTVRVNGTTSQSAAATVVVDAGTLQIGSGGVASALLSGVASTTLNMNGTLDINGFDTLVDSLAGTGTVTNSGGVGATSATLRLEGTSNFDGVIQNGTSQTHVEVTSGNIATLSGTNTYTGATTVSSSATLNLADGSAIVDTAAVIVNNGLLEVNANERIGDLTGVGALGVVDLNTNALTIGTSTLLSTYEGGVNGGAGSALFKVGTGTQSITGTVNITGGITVFDGTLALSGANTISGGITVGVVGGVENARLVLGSNTAAGGAAGQITTLGSVVSYAAGVDSATPIMLNSNDTQLEVLTGAATQSGVISETSGPRPVEKIGAGNLTLSAANTYTGLTTVAAGTLTISNGAALGTTAAGTTVTAGATLALTSNINTAEGIALNGTGLISGGALRNVSGNNTVSGLVTLTTNAQINSDAGELTLSGGVAGTNTNLTIGGSGSTVVSSVIATGTGTLTKEGAGTATLTQTNTFTGNVQINAGVLQMQGVDVIADSVLVTVGTGAALNVTMAETLGNIAGAGSINFLTNSSTLTVGNAAPTSTFSGVISETAVQGSLTKQGTGTLSLSGANTYTGTTTVNDGTLDVTGSVASTSLVVNGAGAAAGILQVDGASLVDTATVTLNDDGRLALTGSETIGALVSSSAASTVALGANTLTTGTAATDTFAGVISGTGGLTKAGAGVVILTGANDFSGTTTINGGTLQIGANGTTGTLGTGAVINNAQLSINRSDAVTVSNAISGGGNLTQAGAGTTTLTGANTYSGLTQIVQGTLQVGNGGTTGTLGTGSVTNDTALVFNRSDALAVANVISGAGTVTQTGTGTTTLSGMNLYTGLTTVNNGTLEVTGQITGNVLVDAVGRLRIGNTDAIGGTITATGGVVSYAAGVNEASALILNSNTAQLEVLAADAATQSGVISELGGARPVQKVGTGTLTLSGANTYTGTTTVSAGTLIVSGGAAISDTAGVTVASGATFQLATSEAIGPLSGVAGSTVNVAANTLTVTNGAGATFGGNIAGTGTFDLQGSTTLTLTGVNAITGTVGTGAFGPSTATLIIAAGASVAAETIGAIAGSTVVLNGGALTDNGAVIIAGGTVTLNGSETAGAVQATGAVQLNGAGTVLTLNGLGTTLFPAGTSTIDGSVTGTGTLNVTGNTTTVSATGNVQTATTIGTAGTVVNNGTVAAVSNAGILTNNLTAGAVTNLAGGTFTNAATGTAASVASAGTTTNAGAITTTLGVTAGTTTNTGTVGGVTSVSGGTLEQDAGTLNGIALSAGIVNADGGTVNGTTTVTGGQLNLNGVTFGATPIANNGGTVTVVSNSTASVNNNIGALNVNAGATLTGNVVNATTTTIASTGRISGNVTNTSAGTLNLSGAIIGAPTAGNLTNSGVVNATGGAVAGNVLNQSGGQFTLAAGQLAAVGGTLTNATGATTTIGAGSDLTASVVNQAGATLTNAGTLTGTLNNAGTVTATTGIFTGAVTNTGSMTASTALTLNGTLNNLAAGTINTASLSVLGATTNAGSIVTPGAASFGVLNNTSTITAATIAATGLTTNSGTLVTSGNMNLAGGLAGGGTLNVVGGAADVVDVITIGGPGITQGATLAFDIDLAAGAADKVILGGAGLNGAINFAFSAVGANSGDQPPFILIQDYGAGSSFNIGTVAGLPVAGGKFAYFVTNDAANSDVILSSVLNPGIGAIAGSVTLTQSLIGSVINRPSSPFVTGLAFDDADPCGPGVWARATGGQANASGNNVSNPGQADQYVSRTELSASFAGMQIGGDFACFNGSVNGWDLAAGGIAGFNTGALDLPVQVPDPTTGIGFITTSNTDASFDQIYGGVYVTAARGPLAFDVQYRIEKTDLTVNNSSVGSFASLGLTDQEFSSDAKTLSGSLSYAFPFKDTNIVIVPTAGFAITRTSTDRIDFDNGTDSLQLDDFSNNRAFVGATVARTVFGESETSFSRQFITATYYADFAKDPTSEFSFDDDGLAATPNLTQTVVNENLGSYGEVSVGLNYVKIFDDGGAIPARQLDASIRADARFGGQLDSWGITGQLRLQF